MTLVLMNSLQLANLLVISVCKQIDVACQESLTSISVAWIPFEDQESDIVE